MESISEFEVPKRLCVEERTTKGGIAIMEFEGFFVPHVLECSFSAARCERFTTQQWPCFVQRKQRLLHEAERRRDWCDAFVSCQTSGASIHGLILQDQRFLKIQIIQRIEEELRRQIQEERKEQTMIPCMRYDTVDGDEMMVPQLPGPPS